MSGALHRLGAIIRADFFIRLRRPSTVVVFVLLSGLPYLWVPAPSTGRALIVINGHRAIYNSAAIGVATALLGTIFIGLFGFYVVSNALRRDVLSRCGYVIASTTMRGGEYIAGKFAGNVVFLSVFTLGYMATAMAMILVRGEAPLEPLLFAKQYLILLPPSITFVSAIAILFECTPLLRSKFGDVLYFFVWMATLGIVVTTMEQVAGTGWMMYFDVSGMGLMMLQMKALYHTTEMSIGATGFDATKSLIEFRGLQAGAEWLIPRAVAAVFPLALLPLARLFFHRFDPARLRAVAGEKTRRGWIGRINLLAKPLARLLVRIAEWPASLFRGSSFVRCTVTDALATISAFPLAAVAVIGFSIAALAARGESFFSGVLPVAYAACAVAISDVACREKRAGTTSLVFAAPGLRQHFVWWKFAATFLVAAAFLAIPLVRGIALRPHSALALLIGLLFTAAAATALGIVSANPKTFIVVFLTFWYLSLNDKGSNPALDFAGWWGKSSAPVLAGYAVAAVAILALAQMFHLRELRRRW